MPDKSAPDRLIAELARRQHGAISSQQLREAGLTRTAVLERCQSGRLHRLHRGVYAVGHTAPNDERRWMAAVLALGDGAALSHRSAATLWELLPSREGPVDVSLTSRNGRRRRRGIRVHRPESLEPPEIIRHRAIPVTSPARTLADLKSAVPPHALRRATRQADFLGLPTGPDVDLDKTRSELERRFLWLCRRQHLPMPAVNLRIADLTVDFCWVERRLIVETDGYSSHRGRTAFEDDRARDLKLRALGYEVLRLSYHQVFDEPNQVVAVLRSALTPATRAP
ncbi:MAG TPA: type IV toxin-antitoxin system AbiEi family antitoxin domain-containing protein [Solirubrobacterales bacterium]|nr:type IV toxin-antitoxin system AbiEi family antitoxin domain-containing protein [Solirubrobacterales bacterium]